MLKEFETVDEINEYFDELETKANWKMSRARIYGMAYGRQQQDIREDIIQREVESKFRIKYKTTIISDDLAIVEATSTLGNKEINYYPVVSGKFHNEGCMTFDEALVLAISRKYHQERNAPSMIYNMLRMDMVNKLW